MKQNPADIVKEYWNRMQSNDFAYAAEMFSDQVVIDWPQSHERITGKANFIAINTEYPANGRWEFTLEEIVCDGNKVVTVVLITDSVVQAKAITFSTIENGLIIQQTEYWPEDYPAPENRKHLVEPLK
ncbi:MAG: nuclear transport factor 2 family protein [Proteobacteria bacterium]|nr:nuclear transport factor 2 family protein [Pseudomonadota bacterium]